ncbi:uncharacterized protein I206_100684 [Kwoniella pini CBS 10737]|uniref:Uncharacterized protein n=1 Tax=Kwoniella pini CBS 10737 TaxID=1296096 RepID=A0A1B9ICI3_9TREE|nr:uncharacterized protein I206_00641 [Kwoniella pini CBS 10737]OCF53339.1 hypothetical protein I206_00641 [Kwoniella pini CBS 10737]
MVSAKASSSAPPKVKSDKKVKIKTDPTLKSKPKSKTPQFTTPEEVPSDIDDDDDDENMNEHQDDDASSSSSSSSSSSEVDSDENLENITPRRSTQNQSTIQEKRGKSLKKYEPPIGMSELKPSSTFASSPFEWDALASKPGVELWAIRVPKDLKPSRLSALQIQKPKSNSSSITGSLKTKNSNYTLSSAGTSLHTKTVIDEEGRQPTAGPSAMDSLRMDIDERDINEEMKVEGGEEMDGLKLLVPKFKEGGKFFTVSKPIIRKLILTPSLTQSNNQQSSNESNEIPSIPSFLSEPIISSKITQSIELPPKRVQPTHLLKFRNHAYGFTTLGPNSTVVKSIEIDGIPQDQLEEKKEKKDKEKEKKRKIDNKDSPKKKSKKLKE